MPKLSEDRYKELFEKFIKDYNKTYATERERLYFLFFFLILNSYRFAIFCNTVEMIDYINSDKDNTWEAEINASADLTLEEKKKEFGVRD